MKRRALATLLCALLPILALAAGPTGPGLGDWKVRLAHLHFGGIFPLRVGKDCSVDLVRGNRRVRVSRRFPGGRVPSV